MLEDMARAVPGFVVFTALVLILWFAGAAVTAFVYCAWMDHPVFAVAQAAFVCYLSARYSLKLIDKVRKEAWWL